MEGIWRLEEEKRKKGEVECEQIFLATKHHLSSFSFSMMFNIVRGVEIRTIITPDQRSPV